MFSGIFLSFKTVFSNIFFILIATATAIITLFTTILARNLPLAADFLTGFNVKLTLLLVKSAAVNTSALTLWLLISISILFGINISLFIFYFVRRGLAVKKEGGGILAGLASGLLGAGCASCGGLLLYSVLSSIGAAGVLTFLPLAGEELTILGIIFLTLSIYWLSKSIQSSGVCVPDYEENKRLIN